MLEKLIEAGLWLVLIGAAVVTIEAFELWQLTIIDKRIEKKELKRLQKEEKKKKEILVKRCPYCGHTNQFTEDQTIHNTHTHQSFLVCESCEHMFNLHKW